MKPEKTSCVLKKQDIKVTHADSKDLDEDGLESSFSNFLQVEIVNDKEICVDGECSSSDEGTDEFHMIDYARAMATNPSLKTFIDK